MMEQNFHRRPGNPFLKNYFIAAVFIIIGLLLLGKNLDLIPASIYYILVSWQVILVTIGLYFMAKRQYTGGGIMIAIGAYFLLPKLGIIDMNISAFFWPLVFVMVGVLILVKMKNKAKPYPVKHFNNHAETQYASDGGYIKSDNMFSSVKHVVADEVFKGGNISNKFGATTIDLRRSRLEEEFTYLDIDCQFGGIELYIPSSWNVSVEISPFIGGCDDTRLLAVNMDMEHTLVLRGNLSFGGIEIKS